jgi:hypothetical protein
LAAGNMEGSHGATLAILLAAGFAGLGTLTSLARLGDFAAPVRHERPVPSRAQTELREPAE